MAQEMLDKILVQWAIYGHRRLNVLFTELVKNVSNYFTQPFRHQAEQAKNQGPNALRGFIEYSINRRIESGEVDEEKTYDSDFEEMVLTV